MTDTTMRRGGTFSVARTWGRISSSIVPLLAVVTALIITVPFMILTGGAGDISRGLSIAGNAYSALLEGSVGLAINDLATRDDFSELLALSAAGDGELTRTELRGLSRSAGAIASMGADNARRYSAALAPFADLAEEDLTELAESIGDINAIGVETLDRLSPLITALAELERSVVRDMAGELAREETLTPEQRAELAGQIPVVEDYDDATVLNAMQLVDEYGIVRLERLAARVDLLRQVGVDPASPEATTLPEIAALNTGVAGARDSASLIALLDEAGIDDPIALSEQIDTIREMYSAELLTNDNVREAINNELDDALQNNLIVRRPGNRLVVDRSAAPAGVIYNNRNTPDDPSDDVPETVYLRLGGSALVFFPSNLEAMLVRAIPFIIAGLAVALGFKAGLFNIGAEGQLYIGGILAVWVGFSPIFSGLPIYIHLPLVIVSGILGGALWGAIPGALKAFAGAHEVITTIMLNYIAIRLVDWLIKSTDPIILLDPAASTPRTPFIAETARLLRFNTFSPLLYIIAGIVVFLLAAAARRNAIRKDYRLAVRPLIYGILTVIGGLFLSWISSRGVLHLGFVIMLIVVWLTDWFLNRTTLGFELRTVGENPDAAKYAGMSVKRNIILAMALSGALAGLAGTIEISGVQLNMQPEFFAGLGFDAIAVALLARKNPRNMIVAGLLWGSLLAGAGLMQVRADISIDLVKVIQALIIMFIAADEIIRYLWRVPASSERIGGTFLKGWGG